MWSSIYSRVISRIVNLISRTAQLQAATDAALRQAESASKTAKTLMEADDSADILKKANEETEGLKEKLRKSETDLSALKKQCKNLQEEYDRVCTLLNKKEVRLLRLIINKLPVSGTLQRRQER